MEEGEEEEVDVDDIAEFAEDGTIRGRCFTNFCNSTGSLIYKKKKK